MSDPFAQPPCSGPPDSALGRSIPWSQFLGTQPHSAPFSHDLSPHMCSQPLNSSNTLISTHLPCRHKRSHLNCLHISSSLSNSFVLLHQDTPTLASSSSHFPPAYITCTYSCSSSYFSLISFLSNFCFCFCLLSSESSFFSCSFSFWLFISLVSTSC